MYKIHLMYRYEYVLISFYLIYVIQSSLSRHRFSFSGVFPRARLIGKNGARWLRLILYARSGYLLINSSASFSDAKKKRLAPRPIRAAYETICEIWCSPQNSRRLRASCFARLIERFKIWGDRTSTLNRKCCVSVDFWKPLWIFPPSPFPPSSLSFSFSFFQGICKQKWEEKNDSKILSVLTFSLF